MSTEKNSVITLEHIKAMQDSLREQSAGWIKKMIPHMKESSEEEESKTKTRIYNIVNNVIRSQEWYVRFIEAGQTVLNELKPRQANALTIVDNL